MAVDYDLVILGGSPEGYAAAERAVERGARVALVQQGLSGRDSTIQQLTQLQGLPAVTSGMVPEDIAEAWQQHRDRAAVVAMALTDSDWPRLGVMGVDVIAESGQVTRDRPLTITTKTRTLSTRALLLATGQVPQPPQILTLDADADVTLDALLQRDRPPESVLILGGAPLGLALGQWLRRWQVSVTIVMPSDRLLPQEDPDISRWLTAQLMAEGVQLKFNTVLKAATVQGGKATVHCHDETLTAATLVAPATVPNLSGLGLERWLSGDHPLGVDAYLQTPQPRIYACGSVLGGYDMPAIARQEAYCAVHNALFWHRRVVDYRAIPYDLPTAPAMARVGLTEPQARSRYGDAVLLIAKERFYENVTAQVRESTVGFCKIIAHRRGPILGAHGAGPEASEWVQAIAILMAQKTPWWAVANAATLPYSLMETVRRATEQWERDRWQRGQWRRNWVEDWCNWRRSR